MTPASRQFVILNMLENEGPMTVRGLGFKLGWDHTTIHLELGKLLKDRVVARKRLRRRQQAKKPEFEWRIA